VYGWYWNRIVEQWGERRLDEPCPCRESRPRRSSGMVVFVEDAAETVCSVDVQPGEVVGVGDGFG